MNGAPKETGILLDLGHLQISCKFYELDAEKELDKILDNYSYIEFMKFIFLRMIP